MPRKELAVDNVAEAYLALLAERGVEYLFANAGTDFAPLVEAFAKAARTGTPVPQPVLATHENLVATLSISTMPKHGRTARPASDVRTLKAPVRSLPPSPTVAHTVRMRS